MRLLGSQWKDTHKQTMSNKQRNAGPKLSNPNKGFYTLNLFHSSPLRTSISSALQREENEKHMKQGSTPTQELLSTKLGDTVGTFTSDGVFQFTKKVEIRKVNMHYKLLSDNRAKHVRRNKLDESVKKTEDHVLKPKVDHK